MIERGGDLRMNTIKSTKASSIKPIIESNVCKSSIVNTDEGTHYTWMQDSYKHTVVKHAAGEYVRGSSYTNSIEGAFGHFKRSIIGVYHKASDKHIDRYLDMFAWRWNSRSMGEGERVNSLLNSTQGRKITYRSLIKK